MNSHDVSASRVPNSGDPAGCETWVICVPMSAAEAAKVLYNACLVSRVLGRTILAL